MTTTIHAALVSALAEMKNPVFDAANPHFGSRYATLAAHLEVVRPTLAKHGLAVMQPLSSEQPGTVTVTTVILHSSGERISTSLVFAVPPDPQKAGSAITYMRRYSLAAALGIVGDDDDDANAASTPPARGDAAAPPPAPKRSTAEERERRSRPAPEPPDERPIHWLADDYRPGEQGVTIITGLVQSVERKTGVTKAGKPWVKYAITIEGKVVGTFDEKAAAEAERAKRLGRTVTVDAATNQKGFLDLLLMDELPF
jgi:hypothetical protein